jgi:hypothetical protein
MRYALLPILITAVVVLLIASDAAWPIIDWFGRTFQEHPAPFFFLAFGAYLLLVFFGKGPFSRRWLELTEPKWQVDLFAPIKMTAARPRRRATGAKRAARTATTKRRAR